VRRYGIASLVTGALVLAGCSAPQPPEVTFFASGTTIRLGPSQYCRAEAQQCDGFPNAKGTLSVPGGKPLNISVPRQVAEAPWLVVFKYRSSNGGAEEQGRTQVFRAGEKYAYTLTTPTAGDQLTDVEVQRIASVAPDANQEIVFVADASWVLEVTR
jgi:hypothetical protein